MPILPTSWSSPVTAQDADQLVVEPELLGQEDRVAGDVLRVALGVAVLRVDREDQALEDVECLALAGDLGFATGEPDRVAAARLGLAAA